MVHVFIINPHAGSKAFSAELRNCLSKRTDINYYILHTRKSHTENQLVKEVLSLFEGEKIRIYSCGGSGTFCNIINGIPDFSKVELAFYPKGLTNDFLKMFGDKEYLFEDINALIDGKAVKIDYIKTNHGVALNTFSLGLDSIQVRNTEEFRTLSIFGRQIPYYLAMAYSLFCGKPTDLEIEIGDKMHLGRFAEVFLGNGGVLGGLLWFEARSDFRDGKGRLCMCKHGHIRKLFKTLVALSKVSDKRNTGLEFDEIVDEEIVIRRRDGAKLEVDFDGELQEPQFEWRVKIVKQGLPFVIPEGLDLDERIC